MVRRDRGDAKARVPSGVGLQRRLAASAAGVALIGGLGTASLALAAPAGAVTESVACGDVPGLIAAITFANTHGGGTINLAPGCTYVLTQPDNTSPAEGPNGLPVITSNITINGALSTIERTSTQPFRIFQVANTGSLTLFALVITGGQSGGNTGGGAIVDHGHLTLTDSRITGNAAQADNGGGGIANGPGNFGGPAVLILNNSRVDHNNAPGESFGQGGGIANAGTVTLNSSQVDHNNSGVGGAGGINNFNRSSPGAVTLNSSFVNNNTTAGDGGGIATGFESTLTVNFSMVSGNTAGNDGGGIDTEQATIVLNSSIVEKNHAGSQGGGVHLDGGSLTLKISQVTGNSAGSAGGGVFVESGGTVSLQSSLIAGNIPNNCAPPGSVSGCIG